MQGAGVTRVQQPRKGLTIGVVSFHRRLEQRFLDIARHFPPDGQRGIAEQKRKSLFIILHRVSLHDGRMARGASSGNKQKLLTFPTHEGAPMAWLTIEPTTADTTIANA